MHLALQPISLLLGCVVGIAASFTLDPVWKLGLIRYHQAAYGELTFLCDNAMRAHFLADQRLGRDPSEANVEAVQAAEIGLLDCQDYDLYRKMLLRWGLNENELSEMSLLAIEERAEDLHKVVRIHEIRY